MFTFKVGFYAKRVVLKNKRDTSNRPDERKPVRWIPVESWNRKLESNAIFSHAKAKTTGLVLRINKKFEQLTLTLARVPYGRRCHYSLKGLYHLDFADSCAKLRLITPAFTQLASTPGSHNTKMKISNNFSKEEVSFDANVIFDLSECYSKSS